MSTKRMNNTPAFVQTSPTKRPRVCCPEGTAYHAAADELPGMKQTLYQAAMYSLINTGMLRRHNRRFDAIDTRLDRIDDRLDNIESTLKSLVELVESLAGKKIDQDGAQDEAA